MNALKRAVLWTVLCAAMLFATPAVLAQIDLGWQRVDTPELPPSISVYRSTANLPSGSPIRAYYAAIDLSDPNLEIDVTYVGDGGTRITPVDEMLASPEPVYVATNGSFFGTTTSVVPIIDNGNVLAYGQQGISRNNTVYYPTWGVWGLDANRVSEVAWAWGNPGAGAIYAYDQPYPNSLLETPLPPPTLLPPFPTAPDGRAIPVGRIWDAVEAMGGTPVLIKDGVLLDLDETPTASCALDPNITICNELVNDPGLTGVNPRTAIGVTADRKTVILLVIDGRSSASIGTTIKQTGEILFALGAYDGLNLDGGGSSAFVVNNFDGVLAAPGSGNGGNSSDVLNTPSDGFMRPVAMSLLIKRLPLFFDAILSSPNYSEIGSGWFPTSNPGAYPDNASPTRLAPAVGSGNAPTNEARFTLDGITPAEYELSAWWVAASNRATNTPFTIERPGFDPIVVRRDQTSGGSQFNPLGSFHLSAADVVRITNDADGAFVAIDALRLRRVGESVPSIAFSSGSNVTAVPGSEVSSTVTIASPNSGVSPVRLTVYKSVDGGAEEIYDDVTFGGDQTVETYAFSYVVAESSGSDVNFRFEVVDNLDHVVSSTIAVRVLDYIVEFDPAVLPTERPAGRAIVFDINMETVDPAVTLTSLQIFVSTNGGPAELLQTVVLSGTQATVPFNYLVENEAGDTLAFTYLISGSDGKTAEATYAVNVVPLRGDFVLGFVSDMNGSFGATTYDRSIRDSFSFFVQQGVNAVLSAGDMVAGQCASASACDETAMWAGFDRELYSQLKGAAIPFLFTLQNHDAANPWDIEGALEFWLNAANIPAGDGLRFVDDTDYPRNYSAVIDFDLDGTDDIFFVAAFNPGDDLNPTELAFLDATLASPEAQTARLRVVAAGQPLYAVSAERNTGGFVTGPRDAITAILRERNVNFYMSGDSAAYYPGKRFDIQLLSLAEMAGTGKAYIGESQVPPTAITRADIFTDDPYYGRNAIVFTTYDTRNDFAIVRKETLPTALFGFDNEFVIRDDVPVTNAGSTKLSSLNVRAPFASGATGSATMTIESGHVRVEGSFSNLDSPVLESFDAVALYRGRNGEAGELLHVLEVQTADRFNGTFGVTFPETTETRDGLAIGVYYIEILTSAHPDGGLRGHFFNDQTGNAPASPAFTGSAAGAEIEVRDVPALLEIEWEPAKDAERSPITYIYQVSRTADFGHLLINEYVGRETAFRGLTQAEWLAFLDGQPRVTLYQRVIASDGQNVVIGPATAFELVAETDPLEGQVTIPTPNFEYQGVFATLGAGFRVYDIAIDEATGRVWACTLNHGPYVYNADGTPHRFSDPAVRYGIDEFGNEFINGFSFNGATFNDGTCYGVEYDPQGYVYLALDGDIFKLDAYTGKPVGFWDSASGFGFETNPSLADDGRLFGHDVFPGNRGFILRPSLLDRGALEIVREFLGRDGLHESDAVTARATHASRADARRQLARGPDRGRPAERRGDRRVLRGPSRRVRDPSEAALPLPREPRGASR
ncbi:MAG: CHRD domain-containing protein, partial [Acidobacteria bacterium]|nr:CHRD domain-containing protein [Acidobacteriota bacterium]